MKRRASYAIAVLVAVIIPLGCYYYLDALETAEGSKISLVEFESDEKPDPTDYEDGRKRRSLAWEDENGDIPPDGLVNALAQRDSYLAGQAATDGFGNGGIERINWIAAGPTNVGGRTRVVIVHPENADILWAGSAGGGVWRSVDRGASWVASNGELQNYVIGCLVLDLNDLTRRTLWAGTGEAFTGHGLRGGGLFKSEDAGVTWRKIDQSVDNKWAYVNTIAIAPGNSNIMLAGIQGGDGINFPLDTGIMRSTDGGENWTQRKAAFSSVSVAFDPLFGQRDHDRAIGEVYISGGHNQVYSTDAGVTWSNSSRSGGTFLTYSFFAPVKSFYHTSNVVFAQNPYFTSPDDHRSQISTSTDGGASFSTVVRGVAEVDEYKNLFWVSPYDPTFFLTGGRMLSKSTDSGSTFGVIGNGYFIVDEIHLDMHFATLDPNDTNHKRVYFGTDGGIFRAEDITTASATDPAAQQPPYPTPTSYPDGWEPLNSTYQTTQFYNVAGDNGLIFGGTQDNGSIRLNDSSNIGEYLLEGDGVYVAVDEAHDLCYGEEIVGGLPLWRVPNCSTAVRPPNNSRVRIDSGISDPINKRGGAMKLDPQNSDVMVFAGSSLWRTTNVRATTPTWREIRVSPTISPIPSPSPSPVDPMPIRITAIDIAPTSSNVIWAAEDWSDTINLPANPRKGRLYMTVNGAASSPTPVVWTTIDDNSTPNDPLPDRTITRILIDKDDPEIVYVAFGGFEANNLWRGTIDKDSSEYVWEDITGPAPNLGGLPDAPIRGIARHPSDATELYVGTEIGLYVSHDTGATWSPVMNGPANVAVFDVSFIKGTNKLLVATYGRGLWTTDIATPGTATNDFDGDGRSDLAVVRPSASPSPATWYVQRSTDGFQYQAWGLPDDIIAAGDYDGDGKTDITVFRESDHNWYCLKSSTATLETTYSFGNSGDIAVPADYDGDGKADEAVYRPSTGYWHLNQSTSGYAAYSFGLSTDTPVAADFDGDGDADIAVWRFSNGMWYLYTPANGYQYIQFGLAGDIPVVGDYDGDGAADVAVWRPDPDESVWYVAFAATGYSTFNILPWGEEDDMPVPGDYDGDGKTDIAVWRHGNGNWYISQSSPGSGIRREHFGADGDIPVGRRTETGHRTTVNQWKDYPLPPNARPQRRPGQATKE